MEIKTNNHWNNFLYGYELPERVLSDFDYLEDIEGGTFFKYKNVYYELGEFMRIDNNAPEPMKNYSGYSSDSFFSGVLIRLSEDCDSYQIATYYS
ncbi:hypothetical protein KAT92_06605 [Candidatus Babeliales bacterium]|nr:hypothetical protein [Candidatus Babeliales bacterium]